MSNRNRCRTADDRAVFEARRFVKRSASSIADQKRAFHRRERRAERQELRHA